MQLRSARAELHGDTRELVEIGALAEPEDRRAADGDERQAPLRGDGRLRERLRRRDIPRLERLLLRASPDDARVRRRPARGGSRTCAAPPRAASPRGRAARPRAGCRASRRPSRRRSAGRRTARRSAEPAARPRAASPAHARRSRSAVSPGVATTASSQSLRNDDDVAVRLRALGGRPDARDVLEAQVDDLALDRRHRLELLRLARLEHPLGDPVRERLERRLPPGAVAGRVDDDVSLLLAVGAIARSR